MKTLSYRADIQSVAFVALAHLLMALQWMEAVRHPAVYATSLWLAFVACIINHNHQHHPTFARAPLNRLFGVLLTLAIGQPASAIIPMHNLNHHVHNNHEDDFVRASIVQFHWNSLNLLCFPFVALIGYARVKSDAMRAWRCTRPGLYRALLVERLSFYPTVVALLALRPMDTLVYVIGPYLAGQWGILAINLVQHDGCDPDSTYRHSRDFTGRALNWFVFNNGYHTAHHLRPGLHWSLLPAFHRRIRGNLDPQLERRSLVAALIEFYLWPGRRPPARAGGS